MSRTITKIATWNNAKGNDFRVYVTFANEREQGVYYFNGNAYNAAKSLVNMTLEEKANALAICESHCGKKSWCTVYENQITKGSKITPAVENHWSNEMKKDAKMGFPVFADDYQD